VVALDELLGDAQCSISSVPRQMMARTARPVPWQASASAVFRADRSSFSLFPSDKNSRYGWIASQRPALFQATSVPGWLFG
jgi:hypothetical protein